MGNVGFSVADASLAKLAFMPFGLFRRRSEDRSLLILCLSAAGDVLRQAESELMPEEKQPDQPLMVMSTMMLGMGAELVAKRYGRNSDTMFEAAVYNHLQTTRLTLAIRGAMMRKAKQLRGLLADMPSEVSEVLPVIEAATCICKLVVEHPLSDERKQIVDRAASCLVAACRSAEG